MLSTRLARPARSLLFLLALFCVPALGHAQVSATVVGTVKDSSGGVLPGATVTLISDSRGTRYEPVVTNESGDFVYPNVAPDTYTVQVEMDSFKTLKQTGLQIGAEPRVVIGTLTLEIGGATETVNVVADTPLIQAASGERSFRIEQKAVENLPVVNRSFTSLAALAPGVDATGANQAGITRVGGGGDSNIVMDGVSTSSPGNNAIMLRLSTESLAEVRVLTAGYQAEFGRASGVQITSVTKSGTNRFRGALYDAERRSDWNSNSKTNILNGDPKTVLKERDYGFSLGGPIGKQGGNNKLFFFTSFEVQPRTSGGDVVRYRMPTALERVGDFSQTTDNNGALYPYIKNPNIAGACSAADRTACYADGGVLGRIPASDLWAPGLALLKMYPLPNITNVPAGQSYNYELKRPTEEATGYQPVVRLDYQPFTRLRGTYRVAQSRQDAKQVFNGTVPGFNDSRMSHPIITTQAASISWTVRPTLFFEGTYGRTDNELSGCGLGGGGTPGPTFCTAGWPSGDLSNRTTAGLGGIPLIYPNARVVDPKFYTYAAMEGMNLPMWDGTQILLPPAFVFGSRVASTATTGTLQPPGNLLTSFYNKSRVQDFSASLTWVVGHHTFKGGIFHLRQNQAQITNGAEGAIGTLSFTQDTPGVNPFDTSYGFANAAIGSYSSYAQNSAFIEYNSVIRNTDFYLQDNWKVSPRLSVDYGVRFVHQVPDFEKYAAASNFLPDLWSLSSAPLLYRPGCVNGVYPCTVANRQAVNPVTGAFMGAGTSGLIGTIVPGTGDRTNGLRVQGDGIVREGYKWPMLAVAPRLGAAYDLTGKQTVILRGSLGLFFDRTAANLTRASGSNPPISNNVVLRYGQLQNLAGGIAAIGAPTIGGTWEYEPSGLPTSAQWNVGAQIGLPHGLRLDVSYVGQHAYNQPLSANINAVDFGAAFKASNTDPTLAASTTPGATALSADLLRAMRGYGAITYNIQDGWRTFHSLQFSIDRRFANGLSFGFNDTWSLYDHQATPLRFDHGADGSFSVRADQAQADDLLGTFVAQSHLMRGNFVWDMPDIKSTSGALKGLGYLVNDWTLSGYWTGRTGTPYFVTVAYQNGATSLNVTGSPDYAGRVVITGDTGSGCSSDPLKQFNTSAFVGPSAGSVGLESGNAYLHSCFLSTLDLSLARTFKIKGSHAFQFRLDFFNAPNAASVTGRNSVMNLASATTPGTITNLPYDASGAVIAARSIPKGAGFGVANAYQSPRSVQLQLRYSF